MRSLVSNCTLHENATKPSTGAVINCMNADELAVQITGTSGSLLINFEVSLDGKKWVPIEGHAICSCGTYSTSTTANNKIYSFETSNIIYFRANIVTLNSGDVSVFANAYGLS